MSGTGSLEQDAASFAQSAINCEQSGQIELAIFYYTEAVQSLTLAQQNQSNLENLVDKIAEYTNRANALKLYQHCPNKLTQKSELQRNIDRCKFLIIQAMEAEELSQSEEAMQLYMEAADLSLKLISEIVNDSILNEKLTKMATQSIERAEFLKNPGKVDSSRNAATQNETIHNTLHKVPQNIVQPLGFSLKNDTTTKSQIIQKKPAKSIAYTDEELNVLRKTSTINGRSYVPFLVVDMNEKFAYPVPYTDKDGLLSLSPKQIAKFGKWLRPDSLCSDPQMICAISSLSIRQTIVSDCSFVASLAIAAQYERRFHRNLITSIIYPQNKNKQPVINPCGKYMVKFHLNGVVRKIIIDDFLPLSKDGELLCSYSSNLNEFWVSLLEKAYLKVMGGYDFPGSNSNIDLHALTGWIPERLSIKVESFEPDKVFKKIHDRFHKGHCLVTVSTGELQNGEDERAGLVPCHAYAMLDIQNVKGVKLFKLKNPWSHRRWKGNYSENDEIHWTSEMMKLLDYEPKEAQKNDNGVFWIDYESMRKFFDVIYVNWDPNIFAHTTCMHQTWEAKEGPRKDRYSIGDNPQYRLEVSATPESPAAVWLLLTRHITDKNDFANNMEFITLVVYQTNGKRIYYPDDPAPKIDGTRINSPHYLCQMMVESSQPHTLVVSQYEKNNTIHYTLRVYSSREFKLTKVSEPYIEKYDKHITGEWKGRTAGGCANNIETFKNNPIYQLKTDQPLSHVLIELRGPRDYGVGFEVIKLSSNEKRSTGAYRNGFCYLELDIQSDNVYNIRPSTYYPKQEGPFFLDVSSSCPISITLLKIN